MLHSGVFVECPYCAFANIAHGQKTTDFLRKLVDGNFATRLRPADSPRTAHPRALQAAVRGGIFRARDAQLLLALPECGGPRERFFTHGVRRSGRFRCATVSAGVAVRCLMLLPTSRQTHTFCPSERPQRRCRVAVSTHTALCGSKQTPVHNNALVVPIMELVPTSRGSKRGTRAALRGAPLSISRPRRTS
jgi:hypothetical protein